LRNAINSLCARADERRDRIADEARADGARLGVRNIEMTAMVCVCVVGYGFNAGGSMPSKLMLE